MQNTKVIRFFKRRKREGLALTYDELLLKPRPSAVKPRDTKTTTRFSRGIELNIPIVSSAMDTVTAADMAIAMAKLGGIGVIHRNMPIEEQASQVARVKLHLGGKVEDPRTVSADKTLADVAAYKKTYAFSFDTFPVVDEDGAFVGMLTKRDVKSAAEDSVTVQEAMTPAKDVISGNASTTREEALELMQNHKKSVIPLIEDGVVVAMYTRTDIDRATSDSTAFTIDSKGRLRVAAAVGGDEETLERTAALVAKGCDAVVIDTSHGANVMVRDLIKTIKATHPEVQVVAGNVSNAKCTEYLVETGVDGILVGQGPGSICTTREVAGVGRAQATAVFKCVRKVQKLGPDIPVGADGGIKNSGAIAKALGLGADFVVLGGLLAGTDVSPGEIKTINGQRVKEYRGMGSIEAMVTNKASRTRYGQESEGETAKLVAEGVSDFVPYKGNLSIQITKLVGGVKSGMSYLGAADIQAFQAAARFDRITPAGAAESRPHSLVNYQ